MAAAALAAVILIPGLREVGSFVAIPAVPIAFLAHAFPNESKQLLGRVLYRASWASRGLEREGARQDIEGSLSRGAAALQTMCGEHIPTKVRLSFVQTGEQLSALPDGTIVVAIAHHPDRARNLVTAAWTFVRQAILRDARIYLDEDVSRSLDFVLTKALLAQEDEQAVRTFIRDVWAPATIGHARLRQLTERLDKLQQDQLLGPIVLTEFVELGSSYTSFPSDGLTAETAAFVDFLFDLSTREPGETTDPTGFDGSVIRVKVIFVARPEVYAVSGPSRYRQAVEWSIAHGYRSIYLLALGRNIEYLTEVGDPYRSDPRVLAVQPFERSVSLSSGRSIPRAVCRLRVDIRQRVGVGREPFYVVGDEGVRELRRQMRRAGARIADRRSLPDG